MSDERPEALLKSALEKIVYFEARAEQLQNDVAAATAEADRLKGELARAGQREIELRRQVAGFEVELSRAHRDRDELARMNDALRTERAALIGKLIEASRIHAADRPADDDNFDLASFMSELRSAAINGAPRLQGSASAQAPVHATAKVETVVAERAEAPEFETAPAPALAVARASSSPNASSSGTAAKVQPLRAAAPSVAAHAERLLAEGRLKVTAEQIDALSGAKPFGGRTEETLFGFSVRELSAPDAAARIRAAERLRALGHSAAAPALATALHAETSPQVQAALLSAFAHVASKEGAQVVLPLLDALTAEVRISALKALLALDSTQAGPHLSAAMKDADPSVRRRASLLALGLSGEAALALGEQAIRDEEPEVRSLGALVLGAGGGERARQLLLEALRDPETKVRKAAAQSLSRILGEDLSGVVALDEPQRRREVRRLASLPVRPVLKAMHPEPVRRAAPAPAVIKREEPVARAVARAPAMREVSEALCGSLFGEIRAAIRGRTVADLVGLSGESEARVAEACELLVARGQVVRRGTKFFVA